MGPGDRLVHEIHPETGEVGLPVVLEKYFLDDLHTDLLGDQVVGLCDELLGRHVQVGGMVRDSELGRFRIVLGEASAGVHQVGGGEPDPLDYPELLHLLDVERDRRLLQLPLGLGERVGLVLDEVEELLIQLGEVVGVLHLLNLDEVLRVDDYVSGVMGHGNLLRTVVDKGLEPLAQTGVLPCGDAERYDADRREVHLLPVYDNATVSAHSRGGDLRRHDTGPVPADEGALGIQTGLAVPDDSDVGGGASDVDNDGVVLAGELLGTVDTGRGS